jgi:hypothetical protein
MRADVRAGPQGRGLVWSAEWDRPLGLTKVVLDDMTVDAFIDEDPMLTETLPAPAHRKPQAGCPTRRCRPGPLWC